MGTKPRLFRPPDPQFAGWWLCEFPGFGLNRNGPIVFAGATSGEACNWLLMALSDPTYIPGLHRYPPNIQVLR